MYTILYGGLLRFAPGSPTVHRSKVHLRDVGLAQRKEY